MHEIFLVNKYRVGTDLSLHNIENTLNGEFIIGKFYNLELKIDTSAVINVDKDSKPLHENANYSAILIFLWQFWKFHTKPLSKSTY